MGAESPDPLLAALMNSQLVKPWEAKKFGGLQCLASLSSPFNSPQRNFIIDKGG